MHAAGRWAGSCLLSHTAAAMILYTSGSHVAQYSRANIKSMLQYSSQYQYSQSKKKSSTTFSLNISSCINSYETNLKSLFYSPLEKKLSKNSFIIRVFPLKIVLYGSRVVTTIKKPFGDNRYKSGERIFFRLTVLLQYMILYYLFYLSGTTVLLLLSLLPPAPRTWWL